MACNFRLGLVERYVEWFDREDGERDRRYLQQQPPEVVAEFIADAKHRGLVWDVDKQRWFKEIRFSESTSRRVIVLLSDAEGPLDLSEITTALGSNRRHIQKVLEGLVYRNEVRNIATLGHRGKYVIGDAGFE